MLQLASKAGLSTFKLMQANGDAMVPRISEKYFRSLLTQTNASDAVSTISGFWSHRADEDKAMFGLSLPEYQCQLVMIYTGEVGNGGHVQFFCKRGQKHIEDHLAALESTSLHGLSQTLRRASEIQYDLKALHLLDQKVWDQNSAVDHALQVFLRENSNIVLEPERS